MVSILCSAQGYVDRETVDSHGPPESTESWKPVPYKTLIDLVIDSLKVKGWEVAKEKHALSHEGSRYFGTFDIVKKGKNIGRGVEMALGMLASYDQRIANLLLGGRKVSVCDNLQYTGDLLAMGRNTRRIMERLPGRVLEAAGKLDQYVDIQRAEIELLKKRLITIPEAHHQMVLLSKKGVISWGDINRVSNTFASDTRWGSSLSLWRLSNSITSVLQPKMDRNGQTYSERTCVLSKHFDDLLRVN